MFIFICLILCIFRKYVGEVIKVCLLLCVKFVVILIIFCLVILVLISCFGNFLVKVFSEVDFFELFVKIIKLLLL